MEDEAMTAPNPTRLDMGPRSARWSSTARKSGKRHLARGALAALLLTFAGLSPAARAQAVDPDKAAAAQALFDQASAEMDRGQYASACLKLEEVTRLVPAGLGAKLALGECYEAQGKLASAWSQYAVVQTLAARAGQPVRSREAGEKAIVLRARLATLTIEVPANVAAIAGITIARDGVLLGPGQWSTPVPVDATAHEIVVSAPDYLPWRKRVEVVADGAAVSMTVSPPTPDPAPRAAVASPRPWQRPLALGALGLGVASLVVGATLGGLAIARNGDSNAEDHCDAKGFCDETGFALRTDARTLGNGSTAATIGGGVLAVTGLVLLITSPAAGVEPRGVRLAVGPGGLRLEGTW